jgi:radical SAM superfamily enzyme YgiQ (UPF0313 family)
MWAEEFILDKDSVLELCAALVKSGLNIKWACNSRVDAVDETTLAALKRAGCWNIAFGIESGNQEILNHINKQTTLEMIRRAIELSHKAGLLVTGHVIIGFPKDTVETMKETERFVTSLDLDFVQYYCAIPYPGTQLYEDALRNRWLASSDWKRWEHNYSVLDYDSLKSSQVMRMRRSMMRRFYFNTRNIVRTLKEQVKRPSDVVSILSRLKGFIGWMR